MNSTTQAHGPFCCEHMDETEETSDKALLSSSERLGITIVHS